MGRTREETINVAEAKKRLSTLLGRVAFDKETILIMRRGRPMARLVPPDDESVEQGLGTVRGWRPTTILFWRPWTRLPHGACLRELSSESRRHPSAG
ncbi:MAG: type II toxin-antitoxin system Phd/YefM family antitoxin [Acidobacteriota bacterium]